MRRTVAATSGVKLDEFPDYEGSEEEQVLDPAQIEREWATSPLVRKVAPSD